MLSEKQIKNKIKKYCKEQDGCDLRDAKKLEYRILGLCEALGVKEEYPVNLGKEILEEVGIKVKKVNPEWEFE